MLQETSSLVGAIEKWVFAIQCEQFDLARTIAHSIVSDGSRLLEHPDFDRCMQVHFECTEPAALLRSLGNFLACVADARERAMEQRR